MLAEADLDGWLLYDFRDQNPIAHQLLGLGKTTRRSFVFLPRNGAPVVLRHAIEASAWSHLSWEQRTYSGWRSLEHELTSLLAGSPTVAMEYSPSDRIPTVDRTPGGVIDLVRDCGAEVSSSADLVAAFHSRWSPGGLELHRRAAEIVRSVAIGAFERAAARSEGGAAVRERELMRWIVDRLHEAGLEDGVDCIVAGGPRSADPHYSPRGAGELLERGSVVLIDLWGRHPGDGIFADQTWMGVLDPHPSDRVRDVWEAVRRARDGALDLLKGRAESGREVRGFEVDARARAALAERGLERFFTHRLGHSIDRELHGSGPNLDDLETRDERRLLPGVGFSVEPGVYLPGEFGMRSEVNVHWGEAGLLVTPGEVQDELLLTSGP